jgi:glucose/arabinose dehydrogenase
MKLLASLFLLSSTLVGQTLERHELHANGKTVSISLPATHDVHVALDGLRRVRFLAQAPDGRIFATDMFSRADNKRGKVLILEGWNATTGQFARAVPYLEGLRNPNNLAFYTDKSGQAWLYLPLTDRLVRYRYRAGDMMPASPPEVLARYPDYGLNYKYGGWHLTRTVVFGKVQGADRLFVSVGSSCNACVETEVVRASIVSMDPDGAHSFTLVKNLRNAVGLHWDSDTAALVATNMGSDQFGDRAPDDTLLAFSSGEIAMAERTGKPLDSGWPSCYFDHGAIRTDPAFAGAATSPNCQNVKRPEATFPAHSSPLGLEKVDRGDYLVALHGAGHPRIGSGYKVVRITGSGHIQQDFMTGFLETGNGLPRVVGRPCGILRLDADTLLVTDDVLGAIYAVQRKNKK